MKAMASSEDGTQTAFTRPALLIIDDDQGIRTILEAVLAASGFRVWTAATGEEGADLCRQKRVAMVLVDMVLPGKDGVETIRDIRQSSPDAGIIAMSGGVNRDRLVLAREVGAARCLTKPFTREGVLEAVRWWFESACQRVPITKNVSAGAPYERESSPKEDYRIKD